MKTKHFVSVIVAGFILLSVYSCSKSSPTYQNPGGTNTGGGYNPPPVGGNTKTITISGMAFPSSVTVTNGTIVIWTNNDGYAHTVTSDDGVSFNSGNIAGGGTFSYTTTKAGTFNYHCNIHSNMHGTLIVNP